MNCFFKHLNLNIATFEKTTWRYVIEYFSASVIAAVASVVAASLKSGICVCYFYFFAIFVEVFFYIFEGVSTNPKYANKFE